MHQLRDIWILYLRKFVHKSLENIIGSSWNISFNEMDGWGLKDYDIFKQRHRQMCTDIFTKSSQKYLDDHIFYFMKKQQSDCSQLLDFVKIIQIFGVNALEMSAAALSDLSYSIMLLREKFPLFYFMFRRINSQ